MKNPIRRIREYMARDGSIRRVTSTPDSTARGRMAMAAFTDQYQPGDTAPSAGESVVNIIRPLTVEEAIAESPGFFAQMSNSVPLATPIYWYEVLIITNQGGVTIQ